MKGGIYSDERCPICGSRFQDDHRSALRCPNHPNIVATKHQVIFGTIHKRLKSYSGAFTFLTGCRFKTDEQTFDERDYKKDNPLGFISLSRKFLERKQQARKKGAFKNIRRHIELAQEFFQQRNVKDLKYGDFDDFQASLNLADKTKHNVMSTVHHFFSWLHLRQDVKIMPTFPVIAFEMEMRRTLSKSDQGRVLDELKRIAPYKVWLGIKLLTTYISIRPAEMTRIKEGDIDRELCYLYIPHPKEKKFKAVPVLQEDIEMMVTDGKTFPGTPYFRHPRGVSGVAENEPYGEKYFYKWWIKACANLGIVGVDLYGGTMHTSTRALREYRTPEQIKKATMRSTSKAFNRYFDIESDDVRDIYRDTAKVLNFTKTLPGEKKGNESH